MFTSQDSPDAPNSFPEEVQDDVNGLIWLGHLEDRFTFCGHEFAIRTLRGDEELLAALIVKDYTETIGQAKAHVWATVGLALVAIDGVEDFCPPASPSKKDYANGRFQYVSSGWYWPTALAIFNRYTALLERQREALEALEDFWSGSLSLHMPFAGSSTAKGFSEESQEDIMDYLDDSSTPSSSDS